ncbi:MAG TPA: flagellar export protein FliJ [Acidobacteriota bacterium]|nr:flagellar export protein FliJ [Acidobacteriota bacterium]
MKKFVFNLETLLQHRITVEEKERNELRRLQYLFQTEINHRNTLHNRLGETALELSQLQSGNATDSGEVEWFCLYMDRMRHEIALSDKRIAQLEQDLQAQKVAVIEATKKTKVLDSLKTRKQKEYSLAVERQGQKAIDEIVVTRFARKNE